MASVGDIDGWEAGEVEVAGRLVACVVAVVVVVCPGAVAGSAQSQHSETQRKSRPPAGVWTLECITWLVFMKTLLSCPSRRGGLYPSGHQSSIGPEATALPVHILPGGGFFGLNMLAWGQHDGVRPASFG